MEDNARARDFLQRRAVEEHVALPPLLRTPRTWRWPLRSPQGEPDVYPVDPHRYARKLVVSMGGVLALGSLVTGLNYAVSVSVPWALGMVLDAGLEHGLNGEIWVRLAVLTLVILGVALTQMAGQLTEIAVQMTAVATPARVAGRKLAFDGRAVNRELESGDVVTSMLTDVDRIGRAALWIPEMVGAILSTVMILVIMFRTSPPLAWTVLIGLPIVTLLIGLLGKPLQRRQTENRDEQGKLTEISADAVAGLRVLRGIGGEDVFGRHYQGQSARVRDAGIRVALPAALLGVLRSVIPMLFTALVVGIGAILYFHNELSVGSLVAFFGFSQFLRNPIVVATRSMEEFTRAWVGVRKLARIQGVTSLVSKDMAEVSGDALHPNTLPQAQWREKDFGLAQLTDTVSEVTVKPGLITGLVCANPDASAAVARRLARQEDSAQPTLLIDGTDARTLPLDLVRRAIILSDTDPQLFAGTLRDQVRGANTPAPRERGVRELVGATSSRTRPGKRTRSLFLKLMSAIRNGWQRCTWRMLMTWWNP